jgi:signal transduction histidine kinase/ligand-binding sensor domain-containing protein/AraC-like DNA-binding protein
VIGASFSSCSTVFSIGKRVRCKKTSLLLLIFTFLVLSYSSISYPQQAELKFEDVPLNEGVQPSVQYIFQDRIGYLWFATWSGLYKYDGYNFTTYQHDVDDTTSLFDNTLSTIYEDKDGILWIGSHFGLERFDPLNEKFTHFIPNLKDTIGNMSNEVSAIYEDKFGTLWIGTSYGLYKFDRTNNNFICLKHDSTDPGSIASNGVRMICEDKQGNIWFGTNAGLDKFDFTKGKFLHCYTDPNKKDQTGDNSPPMFATNCILEDDKNILWLGTDRGLVEFNSEKYIYVNHLFIPKDPINSITSISQDVVTNSLWLATTDGLFSFDKTTKKFTHYNSQENFILSERSGTLWLGTNTGIKKLNMFKQPFKKYPTPEPILLVAKGREGIVWFMYHGLRWNKFDIKKEKLVPYSFGKNSLKLILIPNAEEWLRTENGSLFIQDTLGLTKFSLDSSWKDYIDLTSIYCPTNNGIYVGGWDGHFDFWDFKTNQVIKIRKFQQPPRYVYKDLLGLVWISTYMGELYLYNPVDGTFKEYIIDTRNPTSLSGNRINQIYKDIKGRLWFATNAGLNRLERATENFIHYTIKNGLASDNIRGILEDDLGNLWLNTSKGIIKFDPETGKCKNYDVSYGLDTPTDYSYGFGCKISNGAMFFPSAGGLTYFHPDSVKDNPFIPPIVITLFKKFDKSYPIAKEIQLPYDENFLSFEFAALSYISPERNQYAHKMEGLDKDWVYSGTRRYVSYPNLDPGEYVFRVKGSNNDGIWNEAGTSISIIISPPWWKTTWAYIFYSIFILSLIYITWKMQLKRMRMSNEYKMTKFEAEKLHEVDEMKSRFFTNISHEFRTPLMLILGPAKQIIESTKEQKTKENLVVMHKNAKRLLGLVSQLLDISKLESGNMKLQTSPRNIVSFLKALVLSFTSYAERKRITLKFISSEDEIIAYIDKDKIEKIITNVLSNAFKFTPDGGLVEVNIQPTPRPSKGGDETSLNVPSTGGDLGVGNKGIDDMNFIAITIRDTGVGIPKEKLPKIFDRFYQVDGSHTREQEGTGIGLSLTKELVELHKGKIEVESDEGKGTIVTISIPLGKDHLKPEEIVEGEKEYACPPDTMSAGEKEKDKVFVEEEVDIQTENREEIDYKAYENESQPLLLLVEDNTDVRNYIKSNLSKDYRILEAVNGEDGWNKCIESPSGGPDLIVSDVMMPKMDGYELCEKIKTDERTSHIPVILLTAKAASDDKIEGYKTGADDYIMKPFEPAELKARIQNLIEQRKRLHQYFQNRGIFELSQQKITSVDKKFLQKIHEVITQHISDSLFDVEELTDNVAVSRAVLYKKLEALTGEPPAELIRRIRLNRAAELIEQDYGNISEIALEVGFTNPAYFSDCFRKHFGIPPSQYRSRK